MTRQRHFILTAAKVQFSLIPCQSSNTFSPVAQSSCGHLEFALSDAETTYPPSVSAFFLFFFLFFLSQASSNLRTDISSCVVQSRRPSAGEQRQLTAVFLTRAAQSRTEGRQREETEEVLSEDDGGRGGGCVLVDSLQRDSCEGSLLAVPSYSPLHIPPA